jgi:hypothetical protein
VQQVYLRSDSAGYQVDLLRYCAEGRNKRFGEIGFAIGVEVQPAFKKAVAEVAEEDWDDLYREEDGRKLKTGQQWAEVCFVPTWLRSKKGPEYRYVALREPLRQLGLPGMDQLKQLPFPTMQFGSKGTYRVTGIVTNRTMGGQQLIEWYRERCGRSEQAHSVMKTDLAGSRLPSGHFGANAAWWGIMLLTHNLHVMMNQLVLGGRWFNARLKALRYWLIKLPGRVVTHARMTLVKLGNDHPSLELLWQARDRIVAVANAPPG